MKITSILVGVILFLLTIPVSLAQEGIEVEHFTTEVILFYGGIAVLIAIFAAYFYFKKKRT